MQYTVLFLVGLTLVAAAVGVLAGPWWGILLAGIFLTALGVLGTAFEMAPGGRPTTKAPTR
jgi:hypothetical protein